MNQWLESKNVSEKLKQQILSYSKDELNDAFKSQIEFGTAGMRGVMGAGTNRINENVIVWATYGYAKFLKNIDENPSIVIAYDNRKNSDEYAFLCAKVLSNFNIKVYLFKTITPTPQLSFTIRSFSATGGINITASHNPKSDNGYKLYDQNGCQYLPNTIDKIKKFINEMNILDVEISSKYNQDLINLIDTNYEYANLIVSTVKNEFLKQEKIVFTPLHGCARVIVPMINSHLNFDIEYVENQMNQDSNFTTISSPNPENALTYEFPLNNSNGNYILATDPDADRVGLYDVRNNHLYTGNQIAILLMQYLVDTKRNFEGCEIIYSAVSSKLPAIIASKNNIGHREVLTGFKYIGDLLNPKTFLFGFEESNGYLLHTHARDKDGISALFTIIEMINYYYNKNTRLFEQLQNIYRMYGYQYDTQDNFSLNSIELCDRIMNGIDFETFDNIKCIIDYRKSIVYFEKKKGRMKGEKTNMIKVIFNDASFIAIRPSGTEPKIKIYYSIVSNSYKEANNVAQNYRSIIKKLGGL